jgi:hypothetical protein
MANLFPHDPGCANPTNLTNTAFIDTAASKSLVTTTTKKSAATSKNLITIIQLSGNRMRSTHTIDLLLQKLPPNTRMAHSLPGLMNNLLFLAVQCNAGCKVFFQKTGCKVTLNGEVIFHGWRAEPTAVAHSLYDCNNTQQLIWFYHACLFPPVVSTLSMPLLGLI